MTSDVPQTNSFETNTLLHTHARAHIYIYKTTLVQFSRRSITEKYRVPPVPHRPTTRQLRRAGRDIWTVSWKISWELITEIRDRASGVVGADSLSLSLVGYRITIIESFWWARQEGREGERNGLVRGRFAGPVIITSGISSRVRRANHD